MTTSARPGQITQLPVTWEIRRVHDNSVVSAHCCLGCVTHAFGRLTTADMMGEHPPGPLEWAEVEAVNVATGEAGMFTRALVPLDGLPPAEVISYPEWC